jgi:hypothetical protein
MALGDYNNDGQVDYFLTDATYTSGGVTGGVWVVTNKTQTVVSAVPITAVNNGHSTVDFENLQVVKGQISGKVFLDHDGNGIPGPGDPALAGVTVFIDLNGDGKLGPFDPHTTTNASGLYAFTGLRRGLTGRVMVLSSSPNLAALAPQGFPLATNWGAQRIDFAIKQRLLGVVHDVTVKAGQTLNFTVPLTMAGRQGPGPGNGRLVFSLGHGAPAGMTIDPLTGRITWRPGKNHVTAHYEVTVRVRNSLQPIIADTRTFKVTVVGPPPPPPNTIPFGR